MKITIVTIGKLKEKYLVDAADEYIKRLKPYVTLQIIELSEQRTVDLECDNLINHIPKNCWICVLDVHGKVMSSENFAETISDSVLYGQSHLVFVIGGAFGINDKLRKSANLCLSLSKMTFTHQMTRIILLEQIYRAFKINRGEKYHW